MKPLIDVAGKRVVLTGGLGFLGSAMCKALADSGATVYCLDLHATGTTSGTYMQCDVTDERALKDAAAKIGAIDVLVNNAAFNPKVEAAGVATPTFADYPLEKWEEELRVNLTGTMLASRAFKPSMKSGASIINISSVYSLVAPDQRLYPAGFEKPAVYGASKAGVVNLTKHLAALWGKEGIRVNAVVYGGVENGQDAAFVQKYAERTPLRRMARVEDVPGVIVFLASDASAYASGSTFVIDGGFSAW